MVWGLPFGLALFAVTAVGGEAREDQGLSFSIQTDKPVYQTGDPINLKMELKNTGRTTLRINRNFVLHSDLRPQFRLKSADQNLTWLPPPFPAEVNVKSFVSLAPGRSIRHDLLGLDGYLTVSQSGGYPDPGVYIIQLVYVGVSEDFRTQKTFPGWKGTVSSNTVEVVIRTKQVKGGIKGSIGTATMAKDGTINLMLRAEGSGGVIGDAQFVYPPTHPEYQKILKHLGGLSPGQTKPVPPWN